MNQLNNNSSNMWEFLGYLLIGVVALSYWLARRVRAASVDVDGPILASSQLVNSGKLTSLHKGQVEGYECNFIMGSNGRLIVYIGLPRNTLFHFVAIGDKSGVASKLTEPMVKEKLRKLDLEGNFPSYFAMYCAEGTEQELLQLFDPADMAYFVDFCRAHDFELHHAAIYISRAAGADDENDTTTLAADVEAFLKRNQRLLSRLENHQAALGKHPVV